MRPFTHARPARLDDALDLLDATTAGVMAATDGLTPTGTVPRGAANDLLDLIKEGLFSPSTLVDLRGVEELSGITRADDGGLLIGATTTIADVARHEAFAEGPFRAVGEAAAHIAHPQIRETGTVAGSLLQRPRCWYFRLEEVSCAKKGGQGCPAIEGQNQLHAIFGNDRCAAVHPATLATPFLALDALVEVRSAGGRRSVPIADFFVTPEQDVTRENVLAPGEIVTAVVLPAPADGAVSAHTKQGQRESYDWAFVDVAATGRREGDRLTDLKITLGSVAPVPLRARAAEAILAERGTGPEAFRAAANAAAQGATPLARNRFKLPMLRAVVRRTLEKL